ncbi:hypothetical protein BDY24DRAFT_398331 [Mrakia frigida]|uniref:uncharacterized protein n=1 Tax=Mrakia frigida TaxID=29902 RepID=UPI003FCC1546
MEASPSFPSIDPSYPRTHYEQQQGQLPYPSTQPEAIPPPPFPKANGGNEDALLPPPSLPKPSLKFKLVRPPPSLNPPANASQAQSPSSSSSSTQRSDDEESEADDPAEQEDPHPPPPFPTAQMTSSTRRDSGRSSRGKESGSEFEGEESLPESEYDSAEEEEAPIGKKKVPTTSKAKKEKSMYYEGDSDESGSEEEYRERKNDDARNMRKFVEDDDEEEEDEDGRPIPPRKKFPPRKTPSEPPVASSSRPSRAASKGKGRAQPAALSNGIRRSSRSAGIPPEFDTNVPAGGSVVGTSVGGDFDDGAAAFLEPSLNGGSEAGSVAPVKAEISYKEVEEDDGEDEDEDEHPVQRGGRRLTRQSTVSQSSAQPTGRTTRNSTRHVQIATEVEESDEATGPRKLRERKSRPNYVLQPPQEIVQDARKGKGGASGGRSGGGYNKIPWNSSGKELSRHLGLPGPGGDDSDDDFNNTPRKAAPAPNMFGPSIGGAGGGFLGAPPPLPLDSGPSNLGKVGDSALSDADPLGVNTKVTFDSVGGLDQHIQQLKEMVSLPLLYPELFLRFKVTPPRGVLFHGPPGTGKTLVARALAASCSTGGTKISFFMRKGADCLSKWVGEAERQLRLLFEEARACQPSIIFFDEIDGLAPVRSSKQDQIHASIVSTLLALMDGMDGRGQVIVIGATNRPDAVDPALRRPGRFDREFYFPLPNKTARRKILDIHTGGWEPALGDEFLDNLAGITKGYGGADLRALCTEASLNAIQRRYPQIYKTNDRLLLEPESISVQAKDFMISVKNLIPSSARATASAAAPLPTQLVPLLADSLSLATKAIDKALPPVKKRNVLEEAEWETDDPNEGSFEKEMMLQSLESLRVYRPRILIYGEPGSGQSYIGAAVLHHLEGFHVQSLDIGTLMGDSTRSIEAAIVQLFVEAKRHKPSVLYIPSLSQWANTMTEMARSTVKALLDSLAPSDPVMLLAVVDGNLDSLPRDVKAWFGYSKENRVALKSSSQEQRASFFAELVKNVSKPPNEFPDAVPKRRRVLEVLPIAPPLPPRGPSATELAAQLENDARLREHVKWRLGPVLTELKRKYKRFMKPVQEDFDNYNQSVDDIQAIELQAASTAAQEKGVIDLDTDPNAAGPSNHNGVNGHVVDGEGGEQEQAVAIFQRPRRPHDIDLEKMHSKLYYDRYLTAEQFLEDLNKIVENAELDYNDTERLWKAKQMVNQASLLVDAACDAQFRLDCQRMAQREADREKEKVAASKGKGKEKEVVADPKSIRHSTRGSGKGPEFVATDPVALERLLKRQREGSMTRTNSGNSVTRGSEDVDMELPPLKRPRADELDASSFPVAGPSGTSGAAATTNGDVEMEDGTSHQPLPHHHPLAAPFLTSHEIAPVFPTTEPLVEPSSSSSVVVLVPSSSRPGSPVVEVPTLPGTPIAYQSILPASSLFQGSPSSVSSDSTLTTALAALPSALIPNPPHVEPEPVVVEPEVPPPPPPTFVLPSEAFESLTDLLAARTNKLNVEQLEQIRAMLLDCVWRKRADWDREEMISEMGEIVEEFVGEVEADMDGEWAD